MIRTRARKKPRKIGANLSSKRLLNCIQFSKLHWDMSCANKPFLSLYLVPARNWAGTWNCWRQTSLSAWMFVRNTILANESHASSAHQIHTYTLQHSIPFINVWCWFCSHNNGVQVRVYVCAVCALVWSRKSALKCFHGANACHMFYHTNTHLHIVFRGSVCDWVLSLSLVVIVVVFVVMNEMVRCGAALFRIILFRSIPLCFILFHSLLFTNVIDWAHKRAGLYSDTSSASLMSLLLFCILT